MLTSDMQLAKITSVDEDLKRSISPSSMAEMQIDESRFYVHKKIVVGSFVKRLFLADEHSGRDGFQYSFKWKLFVNGPPEVIFEIFTFSIGYRHPFIYSICKVYNDRL